MTHDVEMTQRKIDSIFESSGVFDFSELLLRIIAAAKKGAADPDLLDEGDVQLVCQALLAQYAQMGIG